MFEVAKKIDDKSFFIRLNTLCTAADAIASDVQYHQRCWLYAQRNAKKINITHCDTDSIEIDDTSRIISDIELLNVVKCELDSEKLCSTKERNNIIGSALENAKDNMSNIFETARSIRKNIIKARPWKFDGSFENYSAPEMLQTLIKWIIAGPRNERETEKRKRYIDQTTNNITQLIYQATKSDSQLRYKPTSDSKRTFIIQRKRRSLLA